VIALLSVFINGYGNIGRRLGTALAADKEIHLIGVGKYSANEKTLEALKNGLDIYVPTANINDFEKKGYRIKGTIQEAVGQSDLIIDATMEGGGFNNKKHLYEPMQKPAIFQGGEDRHGDRSVAEMIHNSRVNYEKASDQTYVIQGSCNVSGMGRIMQPLIEQYSGQIKRYDVTLVRRWADLEDSKDVNDSIEWDKLPHHQEDVKDFIPAANLYVEAYKVPSRMMHLHQMIIRFRRKAPNKEKIIEIFRNEFGVAILNKVKGTGELRNKAIQLGFPHGDTHMVHIHEDIMRVQDDTLKVSYSDDQTGMVIPENHLLMQSMMFKRNRTEAIKNTENLFQINKKKKMLEKVFR